jgi:hypothetical protein
MAEVVTTTVTDHTTIKKVKFAVTSDSDGTADATTTEKIDGLLVLVCTDPGATAPTDNWDLELKDSDGVDLLAGQGANRDTANTEYINSGMGGLAKDTLTMSVTNAGDSKTLTVYAYFR